MTDIVMPRLSDSMTEGTVVRWLKAPGDLVRRGEPLVEIETDKATITYESDVDGVLTHYTVGEGQTVAVGTPIAYVEPQSVQQQAPPAQPQSSPPPLPTPGALPVPGPPPLQAPQPTGDYEQLPGEYDVFDDSGAQPGAVPEHHGVTEEFPVDDQFQQTGDFQPTGDYEQTGDFEQTSPHDIYTQEADEFAGAGEAEGRVKASPIARRLARKLGVNIAAVQGSGPGGRVVKEDVEAAADAAAQAQAAPAMPTQAPAPEQPVSAPAFETPLPLPEEEQILPPAFQEHEPAPYEPPPAQEPSLIPNFPPPPALAPQQPAFQQPQVQQPYPPMPQQPYPQQPVPSPPPFVQGMTGNFPAIQPQQPYPQQPQQPPIYQQPVQPQQPVQQPPMQPPPAQQPPAQQPPAQGAETATRGHSTPVEPTSAQQTVARRMAESKATAPEFFVETEVDMTTAVAYREQLRSMVSPLPSFNDFVIKAAAQALRQYPNVNAAYKDGHFEQYSDVNIGIVVSATELLAVPTLFNVDQKGLAQIAGESQQLSEAVRTRSIQPSQMSGGTFSISNLGMYGVDRFTAILNPPQAAILAVGAINRRAVIAEDGMSLVIRQIMNMTLTCDHRILYGAEAAEFLGAIKAWLESPQLLQI